MRVNNYFPIALIQPYINEEVESFMIDFFKFNKYHSINENIPYTAMKLYNLLNNPVHIDVLFKSYTDETGLDLSINLERLLYLSMMFLFSVGLIEKDGCLIRRAK